jgi:hypothetical protein
MFLRYVVPRECWIRADVGDQAVQAESSFEGLPSLGGFRRVGRTSSFLASVRVGSSKVCRVGCQRIPIFVERHAPATDRRSGIFTHEEDLGIPPGDVRRKRTKIRAGACFALFTEPLFIEARAGRRNGVAHAAGLPAGGFFSRSGISICARCARANSAGSRALPNRSNY